MRTLTKSILLVGIILSCIIGSWSCKGGKIPELGDISGPATVDEYGYAEYSISFVNATGATFLWSCDPSDAGKFDRPDLPKTGFTASMVTQDTPVKIRVVVESQQFDPVILSKDITIMDILWARTWGGDDSDYGYGVAADNSGNTYVTGGFRDIVDFDPGPDLDEHTSNGDLDIFLSKFDSDGDFQWAQTWGGGWDDSGREVALDANGNIYVTGCFEHIADFDPGPGVDERTGDGAFLSKFDSNGNLQWAHTWGGNLGDKGLEVVVDVSGNAYIMGWFKDSVDFDPGPGVNEITAVGYIDTFLSKFDSNGEFQWVRTWWGEGMYSLGITVDGSGNVFVTGFFRLMVDFNPGPGIEELSSHGSHDVFLVKLDADGEFQWAHNLGANGSDQGFGVAADGNGNVCVTGYFEFTVDFDPGPGVDEHTSNGLPDIFLCKFDPNGDFLWARTWGNSYSERSHEIAVDASGNACITGEFRDTVDFDPGLGIAEKTSTHLYDAFLCKFDSNGEFQWAHTWGGSGRDAGYGVDVDGYGSTYVTGCFLETVDFDTGPGVDEHTSYGYWDIFLSKFPPDGNW